MSSHPTPHFTITGRAFTAGVIIFLVAAFPRGTRVGQAQQDVRLSPTSAVNLLDDLVAANHILAQHAIVDGFGHVSVRDDRNPNRYHLSRSLAPGLVSKDDIMEFDLDSMPIDSRGRTPYAERFIHGEIYKARPDVRAVVHSHAASVIPFGVSTVPLRPIYHMAAFLPDALPIFDIRKAAGMTDMLVNDGNRGRALARTLGNGPVVLMRGHGAAIVGATVRIAVGRSIYLDMNAKAQAQAIALGGPITYLDPAEARSVVAAGENGGYERAWELWKREIQK